VGLLDAELPLLVSPSSYLCKIRSYRYTKATPFFIPFGLVVHFTRIRLSRDSTESGQRVTPSALNPGYFAQQQNGLAL
jgi:hypothetical protein